MEKRRATGLTRTPAIVKKIKKIPKFLSVQCKYNSALRWGCRTKLIGSHVGTPLWRPRAN